MSVIQSPCEQAIVCMITKSTLYTATHSSRSTLAYLVVLYSLIPIALTNSVVLFSCIATASRDRTTKLWDLRQMKAINSTPVAVMPHFRNVNCAYFSPDGAHLVTVTLDEFLHIYETSTTKFSNPVKVIPTLAVPHSSRFETNGESQDKLYAAWDTKNSTRFVIGSLMTPRRLVIFDVTRRNPVQELRSNLFNSVHAINVLHPTLPLIACGSASRRLCLWQGV